jgi:hypothetical protein
MQGFAAAKREGTPMIAVGLSLLWYIVQHPGAFNTIGGGLSVGTCRADADSVSWPIIEIAGRRFLRGFDVTDSYRPNCPGPEVIAYDDEWCEALDQRIDGKESVIEPVGVEVSGYDIDSLSTADTLSKRTTIPSGSYVGRRSFRSDMLQVFGDESHDPKCERVFAAAALFGTAEHWATFREQWADRLGGRIFHASDCEPDHGEFASSDHAENLELYADLTKMLAGSKLLGFGSAMDLAGYHEFFGGTPADIPYHRCFRDVVYQCGKWAKWAIPADTAEFYFDQRVESDYNAGVLYGHIASLADWDCARFLRTPLNIASRLDVGVHAADLYAREVMKHLDNTVGPAKRPMRRQQIT